ncbi:MAG: GNAT family N-acetyltransferase [Bacteroidota bacterium]|nr:GNAT family N-acetyltransferase [Bacteroidota bacterium]
MRWEVKKFEELSSIELYRIMQLRGEVFVVEQNCPYLDADGKDPDSLHLMGYGKNDHLIAYSRIVMPGISYEEVSIGRVVSSPSVRGSGSGKALMLESLSVIRGAFGNIPVRIGAQCYLQKFYEGFGFEAIGDSYMEDGIPHIEMLKAAEL